MQALATFFKSSYKALIEALFLLLPVVFIPSSWATIPQAKMSFMVIVVSLVVLAWVLSRIGERAISIPKSLVACAAILLPIAYAISALVSGSGGASFLGVGVERDTVVAMAVWTMSLLMVAVIVDSTKEILRSYRLILIAGLIVVVYQVARLTLGVNVLSLGGFLSLPPTTLIGSWHDFGIFLGLITILSAAFVGTSFAEGRARIIAILSGVASLLFLILVNVQDVWIVLAVVSALLSLYLFFFGSKAKGGDAPVTSPQPDLSIAQTDAPTPSPSKKVVPKMMVAVFLVAGIFAFVGTAVHTSLPNWLQIVEIDVRPSWEGTFAVGSAVYQERGFLFGSGPNTFTRQWGLYKPASVNETAFWNTDFAQGIGFVPTALITTGIIGAAAWLLFFLTLSYRGARTLFRAPADGNNRWRGVYVGLFGGVVYLWALNLFYAPGVVLLAFTFMLTGLFIASQKVSGALSTVTLSFGEMAGKRGKIAFVGVIIVMIAILFGGFLLFRSLLADMYVNKSIVTYNKTSDIAQAQGILDTAIFLNSESPRVNRAIVELGIIRFQQLAATGVETQEEQEELRKVFESTIGQALAAVTANQADYQAWVTLARVYEEFAGVQIEGAYENAQAAYERAAAENPRSPEPYARLAQLALSRGDTASAEVYLKQSIERKSNYAIALFLLSQIATANNDSEGALVYAERAAFSAPQEPVAWFQFGVLLYDSGDFEKSAAALEQAVITNNNYANALYLLGLSYHKLDRVEDAIAVFSRVQELNPENQVVAGIIQNLRDGNEPLSGLEEIQ